MTQIKNEIKAIKSLCKRQIKAIKKEANDKIRALKQNTQKVQGMPCAEGGKRYSLGEEIFNSVSHGIAAGLSIAALCLLVIKAAIYAPYSRGLFVSSFCIFGSTLVILYTMSTLYHALTPYGAKKVFAVFDHSSIYLLIAGTYTPFCLTILSGAWGWAIFGVIWGLAAIGITFYAIFGNKIRALSAITYILMGWLIVIALKQMLKNINHTSLVLLFLGGVCYTIGCVFYALKKIKWMHCIWHLFTMGGSALHFFSVYFSI